MATNVTEERIELTAVDKFSQVLGQAQRGFKDLGSSIDTVRNALGAVGVTLGAGAMASLYHDIIKATAALDDMAEQTGATVEGLSKIQTIAKIGGHDFGSVSEAMGKMVKGLKGADEEGQAAGQALDFLGIKAKDANGKFRDSAEILQDVAKALAKYEDGGNKVALVQDLLGKGGARYLSLLKDMAEEGDIAAKVTAQQAAEAEKLEKNINRLYIAMEDARRETAMAWTPALVEMTEKMLDAQKAAGNLATALLLVAGGRKSVDEINAQIAEIENRSTLSRWARNGLTLGYAGMADQATLSLLYRQRGYQLNQLGRNAAGLQDDLSGTVRGPDSPLSSSYQSAARGGKGGAAGGDEGAAMLLALQDQLAGAQGNASVFDSTMRKLTEGTKQYSVEVQAAALAMAGEIDMIKRAAAETKLLVEETQRLVEAQEKQDKILADFNTSASQRAQQLELEISLVGADAATREKAAAFRQMDLELEKAMVEATPETVDALYQRAEAEKARLGALIDQKVAREEADKAAKEAARAWVDNFRRVSHQIEMALTQGIVDALMNGFKKGESFGRNFLNVLKNMFQTAVLTPVIQAIVRPVATGIAGAIGGLIPSVASAGGGALGGLGGGLNLLSTGSSVANFMGGGFAQTFADFGNFFGSIGSVTEAGSTFGLMDAIGGFAAANPLTAVGIGLGALALGGLFGDSDALPEIPLGFSHPGVDQSRLANDAIYRQAVTELEAEHRARYGVTWTQPNANGDGTPTDSLRQGIEARYQQLMAPIQAGQAKFSAAYQSGGAFVQGLQGYADSLLASPYLSPMEQLAGARTVFERQLATNDPNVLQGANQLLSIGREVYASGPEFQSIFSDVNAKLADALERQKTTQEALLKELPASILESAKDQIKAIRDQTEAVIAELRSLATEVRRLGTVV